MQKISKYWLFQLIGWSLFAFLNIYISVLTHEFSIKLLLINIFFSICGIYFTHQYRNYILRKNWLVLKTEKLLSKIFYAGLIFATVFTLIYYVIILLFFSDYFFQTSVSHIIGSFVSVLFLFAIWNIIYFSWIYVEHNRQIVIQQLQMETQLKDLELKTLRANLQPHFIFNSLNSIRALIDENPEEARNAITKISSILRNSISKQDATDTLENEIKLVDDYLDLEKIRFEERLHFYKNIDPNSLPIFIPTMMLQTLVENAIKHGISALEQGGELFIKTEMQTDFLLIEIKNSGSINTEKQHEHSLGFGISSTQARLKHIYQNKATFLLFEENNFVIVQLKIPLLKTT